MKKEKSNLNTYITMTPEFAYFLKVNVAIVLFYAFYRLLFYKDTFFNLRRAVLLIFLGIALVYPLLDIQEWLKAREPITGVMLLYSDILPEATATPGAKTIQATNWAELFRTVGLGVYWLGVVVLLVRFFLQLGSILLLAYRSRRALVHNTEVCVLDKPAGPFSFFKLTFLHPESHSGKEIDEILTHEGTHASQWHSVDVIVCELISIVCWVNPFVWLLKREVRHNLEYLADNTVIQLGYDSKSYQYHLLGLAHHQAAATLYNSFNVLHLKNRISMMNKKRSRGIGRAKYLLLFPLTALLMLLSNCMQKTSDSQEEAATEDLTVKPAGESTPAASEATPTAKVWTEEELGKVLTVVEVMPKFPGGEGELLKFIATNIKYPQEAQEKGITGRVICAFVVTKEGDIVNAEVLKGIDPQLDEEAIRVIYRMPKWAPGTQRGEPVAVKYTIPITYRLSNPTPAGKKVELASDVAKRGEALLDDKFDPKNPVYKVVEVMPKFPGGDSELLKFIGKNIKYPKECKEKGIEGRVILAFTVGKDGGLSDYEILRGVDPLLDAEAIRVIQTMPKWAPGTQEGKPVNVRYTVPVTYRLQ